MKDNPIVAKIWGTRMASKMLCTRVSYKKYTGPAEEWEDLK